MQLPTLSTLDELQVATPCPERWADMSGDDRVRHCGRCRRNVYDTSSLTRPELLSLIAEREGDVCVRLYRRADGTLLTADCPVGIAAVRRQFALVVGAAVAWTLFAIAWMFYGTQVCERFGLTEEARAAVRAASLRKKHTLGSMQRRPDDDDAR